MLRGRRRVSPSASHEQVSPLLCRSLQAQHTHTHLFQSSEVCGRPLSLCAGYKLDRALPHHHESHESKLTLMQARWSFCLRPKSGRRRP